MAMTPRAKWMASVVADVFKLGEYDALEVFRNQQFQPLFDGFFNGTGDTRIFIYYQTQYKVTDGGEIHDFGGHKEFFVTDGEKVKLKGKGLYFVRTTKPGKAVSTNGTNDNEILFGEISQHTVTSLNTIINNVYMPLVGGLETGEWGSCELEQKKEFSTVFGKFADELREALKSLTSNITLDPYDAQYENDAKNIHTARTINQNMISEFEKIFNMWSEQI